MDPKSDVISSLGAHRLPNDFLSKSLFESGQKRRRIVVAGLESSDVRRPPGPNARKIKACDDRLRRRVLRLLHLADSPLSPIEMSRMLEEPLGRIGYHMKILEALGVTE